MLALSTVFHLTLCVCVCMRVHMHTQERHRSACEIKLGERELCVVCLKMCGASH